MRTVFCLLIHRHRPLNIRYFPTTPVLTAPATSSGWRPITAASATWLCCRMSLRPIHRRVRQAAGGVAERCSQSVPSNQFQSMAIGIHFLPKKSTPRSGQVSPIHSMLDFKKESNNMFLNHLILCTPHPLDHPSVRPAPHRRLSLSLSAQRRWLSCVAPTSVSRNASAHAAVVTRAAVTCAAAWRTRPCVRRVCTKSAARDDPMRMRKINVVAAAIATTTSRRRVATICV
jgi:hypothetical protein